MAGMCVFSEIGIVVGINHLIISHLVDEKNICHSVNTSGEGHRYGSVRTSGLP